MFYLQIPDIVKLNVGGNHKYTTLRSTLTKETDSTLARMFLGYESVYSDKDGVFFLDGDGKTFQAILDYLKFDLMPVCLQLDGTGFGTVGVGLFGGGASHVYTSADIHMIYQNAVKFGLKRMKQHLEQHSDILFKKKMEELRKSKPGYEECKAQILATIPPENVLTKSGMSIRLRDEEDGNGSACCVHVCRQSGNQFGFGFNQVSFNEVDATVMVQFEIDTSLLAILCYDLLAIGYNVQGRTTSCCLQCEEVKHSSGFITRSDTYCCRQKLYLLNFSMTCPSVFGARQPVHTGFFGAAPMNKGFSFGGSTATPAFGTTGFSSATSSSGGLFGSPTPKQQNSFGSLTFESQPQQQQSCFGGFGSTALGSQPPQQSMFGSSGFGSQPQQQSTVGSSAFGSQPQQQSTFGSSAFGSQPQQQSTVGSSAFGSQSQQQSNVGGFGSQQQAKASGGFSFGCSNQQPQQSMIGSPGGGIFGRASINTSNTPIQPGSGLFGAPKTPQTSVVAKNQDTPAKKAGFGFGKAAKGPVFGGPPTFCSLGGLGDAAKSPHEGKGEETEKDEEKK